nr:hypothetical protein [Acidobacteriota bacterium]
MARSRIAILTPLPPVRSGVAHYASLLIPALAQHADVRAFDSPEGFRAEDYDAVFYQLGNNPHHEWIYKAAAGGGSEWRVASEGGGIAQATQPGQLATRHALRTTMSVVVLHDLVLHHLIVEMTLARGDAEGYVAAMEANHGPAGAAWARGRANGMHAEIANFLMPASIDIAQRADAVIVHNHYARERLLSFGVTTPIHVVPHPYMPETRTFDRDALRARHGFTRETRVIGLF